MTIKENYDNLAILNQVKYEQYHPLNIMCYDFIFMSMYRIIIQFLEKVFLVFIQTRVFTGVKYQIINYSNI